MTLAFYMIAFAGLLALTAALLWLGQRAGDCPVSGRAARLGSAIIAIGFAALGAGIVGLVGAALPLLMESRLSPLPFALSLVAIALGIGFWVAAGSLRDMLSQAMREARMAAGEVPRSA